MYAHINPEAKYLGTIQIDMAHGAHAILPRPTPTNPALSLDHQHHASASSLAILYAALPHA